MKKSAQTLTRGFTLVELLVVIAIIAILAAIVVLVVNPLEVTRRGRDATRLADLAGLQSAINVAVQENAESGSSILCPVGSATCTGKSADAGSRANNGTGWVKVNLSTSKTISVATLPVDPVNGACNTSQDCHYTYCSDGTNWEINSNLESAQYTTSPNDKRANDGGNQNDITNGLLYEVGTDLTLIAALGGTCVY